MIQGCISAVLFIILGLIIQMYRMHVRVLKRAFEEALALACERGDVIVERTRRVREIEAFLQTLINHEGSLWRLPAKSSPASSTSSTAVSKPRAN